MKCDLCDNEATVHEVTVRNMVKVEKHLCEKCAQAAGIAIQPAMPINELMSKFMVTQAQGVAQRAPACAACGLAYAEFRQSGLLGCPECYRAFEALLGPLIERAHEGGSRHCGKSPRRRGGSAGVAPAAPNAEEAQRLHALQKAAARQQELRQALASAIRAEQYERAATIRDELRRFEQPPGTGPA